MKFDINLLKKKAKSISDSYEINEYQLMKSELGLDKRCSECAISVCDSSAVCAKCKAMSLVLASDFCSTLYSRICNIEDKEPTKSLFDALKDKINIGQAINDRDKEIIELIDRTDVPAKRTDMLGFFFLSEYEIKKYSEKSSSAKLKSEIHGYTEIKNAFLRKRAVLEEKVRRDYANDIGLMLAAGDTKVAKRLKKKAIKDADQTAAKTENSDERNVEQTSTSVDRTEPQSVTQGYFKSGHQFPEQSESTPLKHDNTDKEYDEPGFQSSGCQHTQYYEPMRSTSVSQAHTDKATNRPNNIRNTNSRKYFSNKSVGIIVAGVVIIVLTIFSVPYISEYIESKSKSDSDDSIKYSISAVMESAKENTTIITTKKQNNNYFYNSDDYVDNYDYEDDDTTEEELQEGMVWITEHGKCYHSIPNCGNSSTSSQISEKVAIERGIKKCDKCW